MSIRFCAFCSTVHPDESTHCPDCGTRLIQEVAEEQFNDPGNPWPFVPVSQLCLRIMGQPYTIDFSGTHSVFHLWSLLHREYEQGRLYCRPRKEELELVSFPPDQCPDDFKILDPGRLLNCKHRKFSFSAYQEEDPEVALEPGEMDMLYHGNFEINDCPPKYWGNVLGWLAATEPYPEAENNWTYDI